MKDISEIRIYYGYLLAGYESEILAEKFNLKMETEAQYLKWTDNYRQEWEKYESKIIPALQRALGVKFYRQVIDVNCAPFFIPKSDPLIMGFKNLPEVFVDELTHELCHVLLTDNNKLQIHSSNPGKRGDLIKLWTELFGDHDIGKLVHIPVQAMMKHIYIDVLKEPERLERDIETSQTYGKVAYSGSWEYVEKHGYKQIIKKLKSYYAELSG